MYLSIKINMSIGYDDTLTNKKIHLTTVMNCGYMYISLERAKKIFFKNLFSFSMNFIKMAGRY